MSPLNQEQELPLIPPLLPRPGRVSVPGATPAPGDAQDCPGGKQGKHLQGSVTLGKLSWCEMTPDGPCHMSQAQVWRGGEAPEAVTGAAL